MQVVTPSPLPETMLWIIFSLIVIFLGTKFFYDKVMKGPLFKKAVKQKKQVKSVEIDAGEANSDTGGNNSEEGPTVLVSPPTPKKQKRQVKNIEIEIDAGATISDIDGNISGGGPTVLVSPPTPVPPITPQGGGISDTDDISERDPTVLVSPPPSVPTSPQGPTVLVSPPTPLPTTIPQDIEAAMSGQLPQPQILVLTLNNGEHLDNKIFKLQKGWIIQFRPGPSLLGKKVNMFTNHPLEANKEFDRNSYCQLHWRSDTSNKGDDTALFMEVTIVMAGSFHYYFTFDNDVSKDCASGSGYYLVDPTLTVGPDKENLPMDCIQCQTVLSKCMGPLNQWEARLKVAKESGYNMVHFTPLQELGASNSAYAVADQHKLNHRISTKEYNVNFDDVAKFTKKMRNEWKMLSIMDVVLNQTANDSPWLQEHPEATYNCLSSPHLRPAYLLDRALFRMANDVSKKRLPEDIIPYSIKSEDDVQLIKKALTTHYIPPLKLYEFYQVGVDKCVMEFKQKISGNAPISTETCTELLTIFQDPQYRRNSSTVDIEHAINLYNKRRNDATNEADRVDKCCEMFRRVLEIFNKRQSTKIQRHLSAAVEWCLLIIREKYLDPSGPERPEINHPSNHLVPPYFSSPGAEDKSLSEEESLAFGPKGRFCMAHNGWVMDADALKNFAEEDSMVYLRRTLIPCGDNVKLRFGETPADCPFLWLFMSRYVKYTAEIFDGIRLNNYHSTPIHVAEYLLDEARKVNPDLYVIAELFTGSENTDNIFINRLGINSVIRDVAMSAPDSREHVRLLNRYGGKPVGSFLLPPVRPLVPSVAHAIFMDLSYYDRAPAEIQKAWTMLPLSALVAMACCGSGSNKVYDELVTHIHGVKDELVYKSWTDSLTPKPDEINSTSGIIRCKTLLNDLHFELGMNGFSEVHVDQVTEDVVAVTRHNPVTHQSVVLVAYQVFKPISHSSRSSIQPLKVEGFLEEILFEIKTNINITGRGENHLLGSFTKNGLTDFQAEVKERIQPSQSSMVKVITRKDSNMTECDYLADFTPGSVIAFRFSLVPRAQSAVNKIRGVLSEFSYRTRRSEVTTHNSKLNDVLDNLSLADYNRILYRCDAEEREENRPGAGTYVLPNFGPLPYCGLQGVISVMSEVRANNDLSHPLSDNLREGDWLVDCLINRLKFDPGTEKLANWIEEKLLSHLKELPRYLVPAYFDSVVTSLYLTLVNKAWTMLGEFVSGGSDFVKALGLCSLQFCGRVKSSLLPELSPALLPLQPPRHPDTHGQLKQMSVTLAAGLPYFSTGDMRCWGRDTFIALPGNLLITERYQEARWIILGFAGTLRHGLIPNLLNGGCNARFNCRDAVWFWLYSIQKYVEMAPEGYRIMKDKVSRLYPTDQAALHEPGKCDQLLEDVIQEALQRHFQGVRFRERNAGFQIDKKMNEHGFNNEIGVDINTGFVFGGNVNNCGTWMDKMGSSEKAGTKGKPATPRDGSAVEIVGLSKAALRFLFRMYREYKYSYNHVERVDYAGCIYGSKITKWSYDFWENKIQENFEKNFYIHETPKPELEHKPELINKRGIIKDVCNSGVFWADYQLRCNFPIAIAASPDILSPEHAWTALKHAEKHLLGPLGIRTLDPSDWVYRGDYDNSNDSTDDKIARGYNYHQGPEWLWPVGWLLRAQLAIAPKVGGQAELQRTMSNIKSILSAHYNHLLNNHWRSLPELTNRNGSYCKYANPAQSWSTGCILEVLWEMDQIERGFQRKIEDSM